MISATTLRKLATLNLSSEQMAGVLGLLADQMQADEERRANQRDRTRKSRASACDSNVTVTAQETLPACDETCDRSADGFSLSPVPLLPPIPPNNPLTPKPSSKINNRGHRLPEDWTMSGPDLAYALSKNLSEREAIDLFERFCSWAWAASGPNALKANWHQAWQGWVQRDGPKIIAARTAGPRSQGPPAGKGGFVSILMDKHRERQDGTASDFEAEHDERGFASG